MNDDLLT